MFIPFPSHIDGGVDPGLPTCSEVGSPASEDADRWCSRRHRGFSTHKCSGLICVLKLEARAEGSGLGGEDLNTNRYRGVSTYVC